MRSLLALICSGLLISGLSLYIGSKSIMRSFNLPLLRERAYQRDENRAVTQQILQRQKMLIRQRRQDLKYNIRSQRQKIKDNMRDLRQKMKDSRYR